MTDSLFEKPSRAQRVYKNGIGFDDQRAPSLAHASGYDILVPALPGEG